MQLAAWSPRSFTPSEHMDSAAEECGAYGAEWSDAPDAECEEPLPADQSGTADRIADFFDRAVLCLPHAGAVHRLVQLQGQFARRREDVLIDTHELHGLVENFLCWTDCFTRHGPECDSADCDHGGGGHRRGVPRELQEAINVLCKLMADLDAPKERDLLHVQLCDLLHPLMYTEIV